MSAGAGGGLVQRAAHRLQIGPAHTLELARDLLGLSGTEGAAAGAAAQAIFTLLGRDARFAVDGQGLWRLRDGAPLPGPALAELGFAVVDVETTGGSFGQGHRIMEIAVVEVRGGAIVDEWRTLVNPGRPVDFFVRSLTGIQPEMLDGAPHFEHVAPEVQRRIEGRVFVAHNVAFDWKFVSDELTDALGQAPQATRLCTVKLVRCLLPRLRRRNLDAVSAYYGIRIHERHRAYGDALATARVLIRILDEAAVQGIADLDALLDRMRHQRPRRKRRGSPEARTARDARRRARREAEAKQVDLLTPTPETSR